MHALMQAAYLIRRRFLALLRIRTQGVKIMLFNDAGEALLIRNTYGNRELFVLPGGGVGRSEAAATAAAREVREEVGVEVTELELFATYESSAEGKRDTIHLFKANAESEITFDPIELEEARFFALEDAASRGSPATRRRIEEMLGKRPIDGRW